VLATCLDGNREKLSKALDKNDLKAARNMVNCESHGLERFSAAMPKQAPSAPLRAQLRDRIINRITELKLKDFEAAQEFGLSPGQMSRLRRGDDGVHDTGEYQQSERSILLRCCAAEFLNTSITSRVGVFRSARHQ
jgi:hypothetical protein